MLAVSETKTPTAMDFDDSKFPDSVATGSGLNEYIPPIMNAVALNRRKKSKSIGSYLKKIFEEIGIYDYCSHSLLNNSNVSRDVVSGLKKLAISGGGLVTDEHRQKAWPLIAVDFNLQENIFSEHQKAAVTANERTNSESDYESAASSLFETDSIQLSDPLPVVDLCEPSVQDLKMHKEWNQVEMDVHRTLARFPPNISNEDREVLQTELTPLVVRVLWDDPKYCYYQGFHDVVLTFLLVLNEDNVSFELCRRLAKRYPFYGYLTKSLEDTASKDIELIYVILHQTDPELEYFLRKAQLGSLFALPWMLTWFAHSIDRYDHVVRLYDFFIASHPLMPIYFAAALVLYRSSDVQDKCDCEMASVHSLLSKMPENLPCEALIADAHDLSQEFPPNRLQGDLLQSYEEEVARQVKMGKVGKLSSAMTIGEQTIKMILWAGTAGAATSYAAYLLYSRYGFHETLARIEMSFLVGQPNCLDRAPTKKLQLCGAALTMCGAAALISGALATLIEAEKTYLLEHFTNTHYITTIFLFSGISAVLVHRTRVNAYIYICIGLCLSSMAVGIAAFFADCVNIHVVSSFDWKMIKTSSLTRSQLHAMVMYSVIDMILCIAGSILSLSILMQMWQMSSRYFSTVAQYREPSLLVLGIGIVGVAFAKSILWLTELVWLKNLGDQARFLFLHYTIDEPVWDALNYTVGALAMVVSTRGTRVLMFASLGLASISAYPTLLYLWTDYRWYSNVKMSQLTVHVPKPPNVLLPNVALGAIHLLLLLLVVIVEVRALHKSRTELFVMDGWRLQRPLYQTISYGSLMLMAAAAVLLVTDMANLSSKSFYRVFHPVEQKLPFTLFIAGPLCLLSLKEHYVVYLLPAAFSVLLVTAHTAVFMIVAYFYLTYNTYFSDQLCQLFHFGQLNCRTRLDLLASWSHFIEATLSWAVLILCLYLAFIFGRLMKMFRLTVSDLSLDEMRKKKRCEIYIKLIGWTSFGAAMLVIAASMLLQSNAVHKSAHPLITLHSTVYRSCLALGLLPLPIIQICTASDLLFYPLHSLTLCVLSLIRFTDILTQLDYRSVGQDTGIAWSLFSLVELLSLGAHFATIVLCVNLLDMAVNRVPRFHFESTQQQIHNSTAPFAAMNNNGLVDTKPVLQYGHLQLANSEDEAATSITNSQPL